MSSSEPLALPLASPASGAGGRAESTSRVAARHGWASAISVLVLVIWLIPIKIYSLPVQLPFHLEVYRLVILSLLVLALLGVITKSITIQAGGQGKAIVLLGAVAVAAVIVNHAALRAPGDESQAIKAVSYLLSFLVAFTLVSSTLRSWRDLDQVVRAIVLGGAIVGIAALYESRTGYDVFAHLQRWVPILHQTSGENVVFRGSRLRVRASAQHPIALAVALLLCLPLATYLATRARTRVRRSFWVLAGFVTMTGAIATVSRTGVLMLGAMVAAALWVRRRQVVRFWPIVPVLLVAVHLASPGTIKPLYHAFFPKKGLSSALHVRAGMSGSGRLADIGPGLRLWIHSPLVGRSLGATAATGDTSPHHHVGQAAIIFDDQYMNTLVSLGALGLFAVIWLVWGTAIRLGRAARARSTIPGSDLVAATAVCCVGFGASMLTFDAFAFVQATLLFFVIAALGLRARALLEE
jgi:polysaccharide biosynthesis protein PslJ